MSQYAALRDLNINVIYYLVSIIITITIISTVIIIIVLA